MDSSSAAEARAFIFHSFGTCRLSSQYLTKETKKKIFSFLFFFALFLSFATEEIEFLHPRKLGNIALMRIVCLCWIDPIV
jgi:hypothetical protein